MKENEVYLTTSLVVEPPYRLDDGVWRTELRIPGLDGEIWFNHSKGTRMDTLAKLDKSLGSKLRFLGQAVVELKDSFKTKPGSRQIPGLDDEELYSVERERPERPERAPKPQPERKDEAEREKPVDKIEVIPKTGTSVPSIPSIPSIPTSKSTSSTGTGFTWSYQETPKYEEEPSLNQDWFPGCGYARK